MYGFDDNYSRAELFRGKIDAGSNTFNDYIADNEITGFSFSNPPHGFCFLQVIFDIERGTSEDLRKVNMRVNGIADGVNYELNKIIDYSKKVNSYYSIPIKIPLLIDKDFEQLNFIFSSNYDASKIDLRYSSLLYL